MIFGKNSRISVSEIRENNIAMVHKDSLSWEDKGIVRGSAK